MSDSTPSDPPLPVRPAGDGSALIFDWSPVRWRRTRLLFFLGLAVGGHVLLFYLFKVAAPPAPRTVPPARSALLLSSNSPASAAIIDRMEAAHPALLPPMPLAEPDAEALHRLVKGYQPTWERHAARLKPLPPAAEGAILPSVMPEPALLLPPLPAGEGATPLAAGTASSNAPAVPRALPTLFIQSGLGGRSLTAPPVWPAEVLQPDWPEEGPASFMISVSPEGRVLSCLPLSTVSADFDIEVLRRPILALRFSPRSDSDETEWAWVDVQW